MTGKTVLVLGGGSGGLVAASELGNIGKPWHLGKVLFGQW